MSAKEIKSHFEFSIVLIEMYLIIEFAYWLLAFLQRGGFVGKLRRYSNQDDLIIPRQK